MKKRILSFAAMISACIFMSVSVQAGSWLRMGQQWTYIENGMSVRTGWISDSGKIYYVDPATNFMVTGWRYIDGIPYLFGDDGALIYCNGMGSGQCSCGVQGQCQSGFGNYCSIRGTTGMLGDFVYCGCDSGDMSYEELSEELCNRVNAYRADRGMTSYRINDTLSKVAMDRAEELSRYYSHSRPDGTKCFSLMKEQGYTYRKAAENIAYGQMSVDQVFDAWLNSSGHRKNILGDFREMGIGVYKSNGVYYWVQEFGSRF
ncbi:Cysteine-rich secretory protein family [Lachnospiraceae bacterium JC7]|nr:Cysteine-rich secretory protein family [Lachnospiraceae bacterium JC7]